METYEIIDVHERLKTLRRDIRTPVANINTICEGEETDAATDAIFAAVLNWISENTENIKFK